MMDSTEGKASHIVRQVNIAEGRKVENVEIFPWTKQGIRGNEERKRVIEYTTVERNHVSKLYPRGH